MDFLDLAQQCAPTVHPHTLAAIVKTESGFKPFAIGVNKGGAQLTRQPTTKAEAVATAQPKASDGAKPRPRAQTRPARKLSPAPMVLTGTMSRGGARQAR